VRLTYASGWLEPAVRPVLRAWVGDSAVDEILPAATCGRAIWIGWIPDGTREIWISPTNRPGPFAFRLERWETISGSRLLAMIAARTPWRAVKYAWGRLGGHAGFARLQARRALGPTPLAQYDSWRRARTRPFEPEGLDAPAEGDAKAPHVRVVIRDGEIGDWPSRLAAQPYRNWSLAVVRQDGEAAGAVLIRPHAPFADIPSGLAFEDLLLPVCAGDRLSESALSCLAEAARRSPEVDAFYGDEDRVDTAGRYRDPRLKPDWSPLFQEATSYVDAPIATRVAFAARAMAGRGAREWPSVSGSDRVEHVRRVLLTRPLAAVAAVRVRVPAPLAGAPPRVAIIIPTRDRRDLLEQCVVSLRAFPAGADFEIVVVDNDSAEASAMAYLDEIARAPDVKVVRAPGPFNFSQLCNLAARKTGAPLLAFLNNDVEAVGEGWLAPLARLATRPDVGAAGAKLLYPDRTVQHAGVVLGVDGKAAHVQRGLAQDAPGYLDTLTAPREVSAVTGACLVVEARKFWEVGGFDEVNLPIESNDIDLGLRLAERGWRNVIEPRAVLIHHESASRGANKLLDARYADQTAYFRARWAAALRDDPYFHPALSLDALDVALG
jgi:GT2 family glycosyltransferase